MYRRSAILSAILTVLTRVVIGAFVARLSWRETEPSSIGDLSRTSEIAETTNEQARHDLTAIRETLTIRIVVSVGGNVFPGAEVHAEWTDFDGNSIQKSVVRTTEQGEATVRTRIGKLHLLVFDPKGSFARDAKLLLVSRAASIPRILRSS